MESLFSRQNRHYFKTNNLFMRPLEMATPHNYLWLCIECFHSRGQYLCKLIRTKESVCIRNEFNSQGIDLGHQYEVYCIEQKNEELFFLTTRMANYGCD